MKRTWIEKISESIGLIPKISHRFDRSEGLMMEGPKPLYKYPDPSEWDDFIELDPQSWPERKERHLSLIHI